MIARLFLLFFLLLLPWAVALSAREPPAIAIGDLEKRVLRDPVEFLQTDAPLDLGQLRRRGLLREFRPLTNGDVNQGISDNSFWIRARLENSADARKTWVLHHETTYIDNMTMFLADSAADRQNPGRDAVAGGGRFPAASGGAL